MIYLSMPVGAMYGWGICGKYLAREFDSITNGQARLILPASEFSSQIVGDELEYHALSPLMVDAAKMPRQLDGPLLISMINPKMTPILPLRGTKTVGYTFFEGTNISPQAVEEIRRHFDLATTGSTWCTEMLRRHGVPNVQTVLQGVDQNIFHPSPTGEREFFRDRFVIFSGGKFEIRKSQDIVIRAVKVMQDRHRDVVLVNAWFNPWPNVVLGMSASPLIKWVDVSGNYVEVINQLLAANGIDLSRTVTLGPRGNANMSRVYRNSDVGLFPNRCEGGTNLVLMEYMACGKPAVATASTGHADVISAEHAIPIAVGAEKIWPVDISQPDGLQDAWPEPGLDDAIDKLEWAYQHRGELEALGQKAAVSMGRLMWRTAAERFAALLA